MNIQLVDFKNLPKTGNIDGTPLYANPIRIIRRFFLKRNELCLRFLTVTEGNTLDVGCGNGILLPTLSQNNGMIVGVDIHESLPQVNKYLKNNNFQTIHLIQSDCHFLPFKKSVFNSILVVSTFDHFLKPFLVVKQLHRAIVSKGSIIFGFHVTNLAYYLTKIIFNIVYIISSFMLFHNFKEFLSYLIFKQKEWRHLYSDSVLIQKISKKFSIKKMVYLRLIYPIFVALKSVKE